MTPNLVNRRRHLMDWGEELEAHTPGGSSSSQSRGLVMTLLAVDRIKVSLISFRRRFLANEPHHRGWFGSLFSNGVASSPSKGGIPEVSVGVVRWTILSLFQGFPVCFSRWLWCLPSAKGW